MSLDIDVLMHHRSGVAKVPRWTRGHIKFRNEAKRHKSLREFSALVGIDIGCGSRISRGLLTPDLPNAVRIQLGTKRRIRVEDWAVPANAPSEAAA